MISLRKTSDKSPQGNHRVKRLLAKAGFGSEAGSLVESVILTAVMLVGCIMVGSIVMSALAGQSRLSHGVMTNVAPSTKATAKPTPKPKPSICIVNVNTGACSTAVGK